MSTTRTYGQYCAMARGLDVVGDRWTLLIVRELLTGSKRYGELVEGLPGIATNLLADRLKALEAAAVIDREPGAGSARGWRYRLTEFGAGLEPVLLELARWATPLLGAPRPDDTYRLRWLVLTLQSQFDPTAAGDLARTYEFRIGDEVVHVRIADGHVDPADGPAEDADVVVTATVDAFLRWGTGQHDAAGALRDGVEVHLTDGTMHADPAGALDDISRLFPSGVW